MRHAMVGIPSLAATLVLAAMAAATPVAAESLNVLAWCDFTDTKFLRPFEEAHDVTVNVKSYEGAPAALAILAQSRPGDWDVVNMETSEMPRLVRNGFFEPLRTDGLPVADLFPGLGPVSLNTFEGKTYGVLAKFGYSAIVYDRSKIDPAEFADITSFWNGTFKHRFAVYDYNTGVISLVARGLGLPAETLREGDLPAIGEAMKALKSQGATMGDLAVVQTVLSAGDVDAVFAAGEWLTVVLNEQNPNLVWAFPDQGAVRWGTSMAMLKGTQQTELGQKFIEYTLSPQGQALLATSDCYWGMPANTKAAAHLSEEAKTKLRWSDQPALLAKSEWQMMNDEAMDAATTDLWTRFVQW